MSEERPFGVIDALILIAGIGAGFGIVRHFHSGWTLMELFVTPDAWTSLRVLERINAFCVRFVMPFLAAWTPTCLLVQIKKPRFQRLRQAPGFLACLLPSVFCFLSVGTVWICLGSSPWINHSGLHRDEVLQIIDGIVAGTSVLTAWATILIGGLWCAQRTWTDRLGRLTGVVWIIVGIVGWVYLIFLGF